MPDDIVLIEIRNLRYPELQLRHIDHNVVEELACSIGSMGLLQPILVRPIGSGALEIVFGLHRVEACKKLKMEAIPAIVRRLSSDQAFLARVAENLSRNIQVDPISEAKGYIGLIDKHWTISEIARQIGKSDSYVSDRVGLIRRLHPSIVEQMIRGGNTLTSTHAVMLSRMDLTRQIQLAEYVERKHLSVRQLENLIRNHLPFKLQVVPSNASDQIALPNRILQALGLKAEEMVYVQLRRKRIVMEPVGS
jgi:ParB family chromosome partitioning protein